MPNETLKSDASRIGTNGIAGEVACTAVPHSHSMVPGGFEVMS